MTTTATSLITYAVLNPIGGSPRATACSLHGTHLGAVRHLSPGRVVGVVPAGTEERANVALTTVQSYAADEVARVLGERAYVRVYCDTVTNTASETVISLLRPGWQTQRDRDQHTARTDALLPLLAALPDGAGRAALVAAIVQASR